MLEPNFYNWTMSFRLDADVVRPYRVIKEMETGKVMVPPKHLEFPNWREYDKDEYKASDEVKELIKKKSKLAAWFVSHCDTISRREELARKLDRYLNVS